MRVVDSPARRPTKGRVSFPVGVPLAATQPLVNVSTTDNVKTVIRAATAGTGRPDRWVTYDVSLNGAKEIAIM